ncbi:MAG: hemerythrin domain-containing protein [Halofilum sp. (in: g-proteobacteria)]
MDLFQALSEEHRRVDRLLQQLLQTDSTDQRRQRIPELRHELEVHARLEQECFYPALRQGNGIDPMIEESLSEHEAMLALATRIEDNERPEEWGSQLQRIKSHLDHHIHEEENHLFPKARSVLSAEQQDRMADEIESLHTEMSEQGAGPRGETAEAIRQQADQLAGRVADRTGEFARMARERARGAIMEGSRSAAQRTEHFADALHQTGEDLGRHGHPTLSQYLGDAGDELERFSKRLSDGDIEGMLRQARSTADRNPGALFGGAIVTGFLLTRFLKSSESDSAGKADEGSRAGAGDQPPDAAHAGPHPPQYEAPEQQQASEEIR